MSGLLSMPEASKQLDPDGQKLDRRGRALAKMITEAEKRLSATIGIVVPYGRGHARKVSLGVLRRFLPDLFPASGLDAIQKTIQTYMAGIDERISERCAEQIANLVDPRLDELWERDEQIAKSVLDLTIRVARLADGDEQKP